ncbi:unnamed protein product [Caenorhabditis auriculariae]|uniref:Uncharacterized protein n=1 Tax=Caenorhabditis auriculariae TaxID=2777116 RepID=A0A8S1GXV2_9PELO|nr:unnamed protein product [Caenorhabditis auriculariae]
MFSARFFMFRRPDDDEEFGGGRIVKAKPVAQKYMKKLGSSYAGKDFVTASERSQKDFYGIQQVYTREENQSSSSSGPTPLTEDEKNKLSAKILKAEMKGDKDLVRKLKMKLESGVTEAPKEKEVVLMRRNHEGNVLPASGRKEDRHSHAQGSSRMRREYEKSQELNEMVREEKTATAEDQLRLFERALVKSAKIRRHDDESVDDIAEMQKGKRKADEKDERRREKRAREEEILVTSFRRIGRDCCRVHDCSRKKEKKKRKVVGMREETPN